MAVMVKEGVDRRGKLAARAAARAAEERREPRVVLVADGADTDGADAVSGSGAGTLFC